VVTRSNETDTAENYTHAYFLSDEETDAIQLAILFDAEGESITCRTFNESSHGSMPEAMLALVEAARLSGFTELRVTMLREIGALRLALSEKGKRNVEGLLSGEDLL
jgi:hypothetical protein